MNESVVVLLVIIIVIHAIVCGELAAMLAREKGYDAGRWKVAGLWLGVLALIAAAGLPDRFARPEVEDRTQTRRRTSSIVVPPGISCDPSLLKK